MESPADLWTATLFGSLRLCSGEKSIDRFPPGQIALLFAFLLTYPRQHSRDELIELLWPEGDIESCRHRLSQALWRIRRIAADIAPGSDRRDILVTDRETVGIDTEAVTSDLVQFHSYLQRAGLLCERSAEQIALMEQAVALYGEGFLPGFYEDWVLTVRQELAARVVAVLEKLVQHYEQAQQWEKAIALASRAITLDPLVETSHQTLIRLFMLTGRHAAAQRQYRDLTRLLARELNAEPSLVTRALLYQTHPERASPVQAENGTLAVTPLPVPLTTFYGRESVLTQLAMYLIDSRASVRLVTLLGSSGIGKTRLAIEFARRIAPQNNRPSAVFVSVADLREPRLIVETISDAVSADRTGTPIARIVTALAPISPEASPHPFLLVLDNAEMAAEAIGAVAAELLARLPTLRILVTSQRPLGISGEQELRLRPLELPEGGTVESLASAPSFQLFLDRAQSVRPDFPTNTETMREVASICERLEGLPLAIELCAAWAQTLGVKQMWEMLTQRFDLLVSRRSDIPARHRTLRAAIEYSYLQLTTELQEFFIQLSVFRDGWTLAAAARVCKNGSIPSTLTALAQMQEHSLVIASESRAGDSGMRYRMLESLREFAVEQRTMAQSAQHARAHAAYYFQFVQEVVARISGDAHALWAARMADELENIRAMLEYYNTFGVIEELWEATIAVALCWNLHHNVHEARHWIERALAKSNPAQRDVLYLQQRARLLYAYSDSLRILSEYAEATSAAEQALAIWQDLEDNRGIAKALVTLGITAMLSNNYDRAQAMLIEALSQARLLSEELMIASILNSLAGVAIALQDWKTAHETLRESLYLYRKAGSMPNIAFCLSNLGLVSRYQGDYEAAQTLFREAIQVSGQSKSRVAGLLNLATVERLRQNYAETLNLLGDVIQETTVYGEKRTLAWCLKEMGHLAIALNLWRLGIQLLANAESMRETLGISFKPFGPEDIARDRERVREALGATETDANWALGMAAGSMLLLKDAQAVIQHHLPPD